MKVHEIDNLISAAGSRHGALRRYDYGDAAPERERAFRRWSSSAGTTRS
jgi:hypothetical protein